MDATPNIIQLDLTKIDLEIQRLNKELEDLKSLRTLAVRIARGNGLSSPPTKKDGANRGSPSEFIISYIKTGSWETKDIIEAYANSVDKKPGDVRNNISNALVRLKYQGRINKSADTADNGGTWYITEKAD